LFLSLALGASAILLILGLRNILGWQRRRNLHSRSGPLRQTLLKPVLERDGCVVIPVRDRVFPVGSLALLGPAAIRSMRGSPAGE